jgi:NADH-quinone oxidoreductase subunit E
MHMLSPEEKAAIDKEIAKVPIRKGAGLKALMVVQQNHGYISDDYLKAVADYVGMSATELDSIATFYNLIYRKPVGRHVIRICDSVSCWIMGYDSVVKKISEHLDIQLGQTTKDNQFTLLPAQCLGTCDHAPALMINDELYRDLDINNVIEIINSYKLSDMNKAPRARTHKDMSCSAP